MKTKKTYRVRHLLTATLAAGALAAGTAHAAKNADPKPARASSRPLFGMFKPTKPSRPVLGMFKPGRPSRPVMGMFKPTKPSRPVFGMFKPVKGS
jgi:hypothetical protein